MASASHLRHGSQIKSRRNTMPGRGPSSSQPHGTPPLCSAPLRCKRGASFSLKSLAPRARCHRRADCLSRARDWQVDRRYPCTHRRSNAVRRAASLAMRLLCTFIITHRRREGHAASFGATAVTRNLVPIKQSEICPTFLLRIRFCFACRASWSGGEAGPALSGRHHTRRDETRGNVGFGRRGHGGLALCPGSDGGEYAVAALG